MPRPIRQHLDERFLDRVAGLFARHGFDHTSLKDLADAVGLSKAGLLHHFPTKEALYRAAVDMGRARARQAFDQAARVPAGPERDRRAVELLTDFALDLPGLVALAFRKITALDADDDVAGREAEDTLVLEAFGVDLTGGDTERVVRVVGLLSAMAALSLVANHLGDTSGWRRHIVATCLDALGHPQHADPSATPQVEA